jgi:HPt (histidine-containing phosphotransfer) domain-containing protein
MAGAAAEPAFLDEALLTDLEQRLGRSSLISLIEIYLADAPLRAGAIAAALEARDAAALRREAHNMTASSGTLGLQPVSELARDIELACKSGNISEAFALAGVLRVAIEAALAALKTRYPEAAA